MFTVQIWNDRHKAWRCLTSRANFRALDDAKAAIIRELSRERWRIIAPDGAVCEQGGNVS